MPMPTSPVLHCASRSHVGRVRARNEDAHWVDAEHGWLVLSDGMGGYQGGDVAAHLAVDVVSHCLQSHARDLHDTGSMARFARHAADRANTEIRRAGREHPELASMGATLLLAAFLPEGLVCAHVGDSRLYRYAAGALELLTRDHTLLQEQVDAGLIGADEARQSKYRGMLTRGLGVAALVEADVAVHSVRETDIFLLCSDGLTDMLDDDEIVALLAAGDGLDVCAVRLVDAANDHGGRDNITVILAQYAGGADGGGA